MYQPISAMDPSGLVIVPAAILIFFGVAILWIGVKKKEKANLISGIVCLILCAITVFGFGPSAFEQSSQRQQAMTNNILTKYNAKYDTEPYLNDVKYDGPVGRGDGHYFNLTYADGSTSRTKFLFSTKTGEPKVYCSIGDLDRNC